MADIIRNIMYISSAAPAAHCRSRARKKYNNQNMNQIQLNFCDFPEGCTTKIIMHEVLENATTQYNTILVSLVIDTSKQIFIFVQLVYLPDMMV